MFPVDPRDFIGQYQENDAMTCVADNLVTTDAPRFGALFRWSLGDPFFRSYVLLPQFHLIDPVPYLFLHRNLVAFHYGNLTHPSVDPPRIGFLSLVPSNANDLYQQAISEAMSNGGNFERM